MNGLTGHLTSIDTLIQIGHERDYTGTRLPIHCGNKNTRLDSGKDLLESKQATLSSV